MKLLLYPLDSTISKVVCIMSFTFLFNFSFGANSTTTVATPSPKFLLLNVGSNGNINQPQKVGNSASKTSAKISYGPRLPTKIHQNAKLQSDTVKNRKKLLDEADKLVEVKLNYCHHHLPLWEPINKQGYAACSESANIRWNYSKVNRETAPNWKVYNNKKGYYVGNYGYGIDCSNLTKYIYYTGRARIRVKIGHLKFMPIFSL